MTTAMPFGKYRGRPLSELPDDYLFWLLSLDNLRQPLRLAVEAERDCRARAVQQLASPALKEILQAGYRTLARKYHPDHGGDVVKMQQINAAMDEIRRQIDEAGND